MKTLFCFFSFAFFAFIMGACASDPGYMKISGVITYRERIALPENAAIGVQLLDISFADAPSTLISEQTIIANGNQVPIPFELIFSNDLIQPGHQYAISARISAENDLLFITDQYYPAITGDSPNDGITIIVVRAN